MTTTGTVNEYPVPTANSQPSYMAYGSDNAAYVSEQQVNKVGRIGFPVACTASVALAAGSATATITAYDATGGAGGSGNKLSTETLPVTIAANATNIVNFALNGIVKSLVLTPTATPPGCASSGSIPIVSASPRRSLERHHRPGQLQRCFRKPAHVQPDDHRLIGPFHVHERRHYLTGDSTYVELEQRLYQQPDHFGNRQRRHDCRYDQLVPGI